jgi:Mg/Co/Ni transporter MgtE
MTDLTERLERNAFATGLCVGIVIGAFLGAMCVIWVNA